MEELSRRGGRGPGGRTKPAGGGGPAGRKGGGGDEEDQRGGRGTAGRTCNGGGGGGAVPSVSPPSLQRRRAGEVPFSREVESVRVEGLGVTFSRRRGETGADE